MLQPDLLDEALAGVELDAGDGTAMRVLDAALAEFESFGLRRSTVEDITKRAGVGRMTLHRRFPSKQALIGAVFLREIRRVLGEVDEVVVAHEDPVDRLVEGLAYGISAVHDTPLFARLLDTDQEAMLPYLTLQAQPLMVASSAYVATQLDGPNAQQIGEAIIRLCHSILLTPQGHLDLADRDALRAFLRAPITALVAATASRGESRH